LVVFNVQPAHLLLLFAALAAAGLVDAVLMPEVHSQLKVNIS
jgi:hypothetical protein